MRHDSGNLGEVVAWDMPSREVSYDTVCQALRDAGLPDVLAADLRPRTAFGRAVKDLRAERAIDQVTREGDVVTFQLTRKTLDEATDTLQFNYECRVSLDLSTGAIHCAESREIENHARAQFAHAMAHRTTSDITGMVQKAFKTHADLFPLVPRKGVAYFVPDEHRSFSESVENFLGAMGGRLCRMPVPKGDEKGEANVRDTIEAGLCEMLQELAEQADTWDASTRESTTRKAVERWQQTTFKVDAYATYLGDAMDRVRAEAAQIKQRLADRIAGVEDAKAQAKADAKDSNGQNRLAFAEGGC